MSRPSSPLRGRKTSFTILEQHKNSRPKETPSITAAGDHHDKQMPLFMVPAELANHSVTSRPFTDLCMTLDA